MPAARLSHRLTEVLTLPTAAAEASQLCVEVLMAYTDPSPTTPTGAGVSQRVAEVLILHDAPEARVSQLCVELLYSASTIGESGAVGGGSSTVSFGYSV